MSGSKVYWYKEDYEDVLNGAKGNHTGAHPEIQTHFEVVKQAIENPNEIRQDRGYKDRKCYYAWFSGGKNYPNQHMKVVLKRTWRGTMIVVTAYFTASINSQEVTIWTKKN